MVRQRPQVKQARQGRTWSTAQPGSGSGYCSISTHQTAPCRLRRATGDGLDGRSEVHVSRFQVAGSRWPVRVAVSLSMSEPVRYILLSRVQVRFRLLRYQVLVSFLFYSVPVVVRLGLYGTLVQIYIYYGTPTLNTFQSWWRRSCPRHLRASHFPQPAHIDP